MTAIIRTVDTAAADTEVLTCEGAAKLLNVSRTHVNTLIETGQLKGVRRTTDGHRRILKSEVLRYKAAGESRQDMGLDAMVEASERLGLYDREFTSVSVRAKR